jgi:glycosyltransferase involved in cell wall biosynthesis
MVIGIDGNEANVKNRVGVNTYALEILKNIYKLQDEWKGRHSFLIYLRENPSLELPKATKWWTYKVIPGGGMWIIRKLMINLLFDHHRPDVFWSPSHYIPPFVPIPMVCSIMDLGYLEFSGQFKKYDFWQLKIWTAYSLYISKLVLTISEASKKDIVRHYKFTSKKVVSTLLGYDKSIYNDKIDPKYVRRIKNKLTMGQDYILFLSTLKPSKNVEGLLLAWKKIESQFPNINLVIAGKKGWLYETIFHKVEELGLKKRVIFTDFVPEEDKPALIAGAKLFVLPSFWEGFGLDVVSAMATGVPVVVSDRGSLPEVVERAGRIVNPNDTDDISNSIKAILTLPKLEYNRLKEKGMRQASKFSWENTARETIKALETVK